MYAIKTVLNLFNSMPVNLLLDKRKKVELQMGIGPMTSPLPRECSTTEPLEHYQNYSINVQLGREMERATRFELATSTLEGWRSTN